MAGFYKDTYGSDPCVACAAGKISLEGSTDAATCICAQGFEGAACTPCAAGSFKATNGSGSCKACAAGTFLDTTAGTACRACPADTWSAAGSDNVTDCKCLPGYSGEAEYDYSACNGCVSTSMSAVTDRLNDAGNFSGHYMFDYCYRYYGGWDPSCSYQRDYNYDGPYGVDYYYFGAFDYLDTSTDAYYTSFGGAATCSSAHNVTASGLGGTIKVPVEEGREYLPSRFYCIWYIGGDSILSDPVIRLEFDEFSLEGQTKDDLRVQGYNPPWDRESLWYLGGQASESFQVEVRGY